MRYLLIKLLRDMGGRGKGQYIATIVVVLVGVAFYVGMMSASVAVNKVIASFYANQKLADLWVVTGHTDPATLAAVRALPGVETAQARAQLTVSSGANSFVINTVTPGVNLPFIESGHLPQAATDCVVDRGYAAAHNLTPGAVLDVTVAGVPQQLKVVGIFNSPEYLYLAKDVTAQPDHQRFGALYVSPLLPGLTPNQIVITAQSGTDLDALKAAVAGVAVSDGQGAVLDRTQLLSWVMLNQDMNQYAQIGVAFPVVFFLVAAVIVFIAMSKNIDAQRTQIGTMSALGVPTWQITGHFLGYALITCLVGSLIGVLTGVFAVMPGIAAIFTAFYTMPAMQPAGFAVNALVATSMAVAFGVAATWLAVRAPLRETPAAAMRPKVPAAVHPILLERRAALWSRLTFRQKIVARNLFLNKPRALLSSIGIIGCVGLLLASFGFLGSIKAVLGPRFEAMNQYDVSVTLTSPASSFPLLGQDVAAAWGQGLVPASFTSGSNTVSTNLVALDANSDAVALFDASGHALALPKDGVLVPQLFANQYHLAVGDQLRLLLAPPVGAAQTVTVTVAGVALEYLQQDIYTSFGYLAGLGVSLPVDTYFLDAAPGASPDQLAARLSGSDLVAQAMTKAQLANAWSQELGLMDSLLFVMIGASAVLALAVVYNISAINIVERRRDIATLKVLGSPVGEVNALVFNENLLVTAFGAILGIPVGVVMLSGLLQAVVSNTMMVPMVISPLAVVGAIGLAFAFTVLANQLLRRPIKAIDMVESLKSIE